VLAWPLLRGPGDPFCAESVILEARALASDYALVDEKTWKDKLMRRLLGYFNIAPADYGSNIDEVKRRKESILNLIQILSTTPAPAFFLCPLCKMFPV
jgi:hypothetical protein